MLLLVTRSVRFALPVLWLFLAGYPLLAGWAYYATPLQERPFTSLHDLFKPSGLVGQGLGIAGTLLIAIGVSTYSVRKRWSRLHRWGKLRTWLTFHIFVCTLGPVLIILHTTFKIGNIASITFWSMAVVALSGVFGRYVYVRIPKTANGVFFTESEMLRERSGLAEQVETLTGLAKEEVEAVMSRYLPAPARGFFQAFGRALVSDFSHGRLRRQVQRDLLQRAVAADRVEAAVPILLRSVRLDQQRQIGRPFQRVFGYWHVLHIPLAFVMLITLVVHVGVAIAFGYTWIF